MVEEKELAQVDVDLKMKLKLAEAEKRNQAREEGLLKVRARIGFVRYLRGAAQVQCVRYLRESPEGQGSNMICSLSGSVSQM
jgi:hypothetical protein